LRIASAPGVLSLTGRSSRSYFRIEFDPKEELKRKYKPLPVFKMALPEDMLIKAQTARIMLDPRQPIMSVVTVLDTILHVDDPEGEVKRMFADIADRDPVIILERVADALEEDGQPHIAARIRTQEFQKAFMQEVQFRQFMAAATGESVIPGPSAETGSPSATGGPGFPRPGQGQAAQPSGGIGVMGERATP